MLRPSSAKAEWTVVSRVLIWWMFGEDVWGVELEKGKTRRCNGWKIFLTFGTVWSV